MSRHIGVVQQTSTVVQQVPIGGIAPVFRSGDAYKAVGEVVQRSVYTALSAAFPRNGSFSSAVRTVTSGANYWCSAYGNGIFVMAGVNASSAAANFLSLSRDGGTTWANVALPVSAYWRAMTYALGLFVLLGDSGGGAGATKYLLTSPDGLNWTQRSAPPVQCNNIAFSGSIFAAISSVDNSLAMSSADGITWTSRSMPASAAWTQLAYGSGRFLALSGNGNTAATSTDGINWTARTMPAGFTPLSLAYGNGLFVAVGNGGSGIYTSPDGITWTARYATSSAGALYQVLYGNGLFVAVPSGNASVAVVSYDGLTWLERSFPGFTGGGNSTSGSVYGAGAFVFVGGSGALVCRAETDESAPSPSDYLYLSGDAGKFVRVK